MAAKRVYYLVHGGRVQGVGFRYFARKHAVQHELVGWVQNLPNNKVEGEVQGEEKSIAAFMQLIDRGPSHAHVVRLDKEDRELRSDQTDFVIRRCT